MIYDFPKDVCPNCYKKMTEIEYEIPPVSKKFQPVKGVKYLCPNCEIFAANIDNVRDRIYTIPSQYRPTEKQIRAVGFINQRTFLGLRAITKKQSTEIIGKYFDIAKDNNIPMFEPEFNYTEES